VKLEGQENLFIGGIMKKIFAICLVVVAGLGLAAVGCNKTSTPPSQSQTPAREIPSLILQAQITVPNVVGRLDHFSSDSKHKRLIVSALGNNSVEVIDTFAGRVIRSITEGLSQPQGNLYVPDSNRLVVANAENGKVNIYDGTTYKLLKSLNFDPDPDNLRWDPSSKRVAVGFGEEEGGIGMIDLAKEERMPEVFKTGGHPEGFQVEASGGHIFVNVPGAGNVVESIDRKTGQVTKWPLTGLRGNYPMSLNEQDHRLFTVTRKPPMLVVFDTQTGKEVSRMRCAGDSDDVFFDPSRKYVYVAGGQGLISVFRQNDPDHYELIETIPTTIGARTAYFFVSRDLFYLGVPTKGRDPAQVWSFVPQE
jgi:DNA-binding beta-propeller fold protein YncE